jgi:hypothetical protein
MITRLILNIFLWIGTRLLGFRVIDIYTPDGREEVKAVTFAMEEWYIAKVQLIEKKENHVNE